MSDTTASPADTAARGGRHRIPTRYLALALIFIITAVNYADRSSLSITGNDMAHDLGFSTVQLGYVFSAFSWSYVLAQLPGGLLLDRFGARRIYGASIALWTLMTAALSLVGLIITPVVVTLTIVFALRLALGAFESPAFPANARVATMWFPTAERGWATAVFNSAQYLATAMFAPIMGWITHEFGWRWVFVMLGALGLTLAITWVRWMRTPARHPRVNAAELAHLESGGALTRLDDALDPNQPGAVRTPATSDGGPQPQSASEPPKRAALGMATIREIFSARQLWGIYCTQYAMNALTYFFITWFPVYLAQSRGLSLLETGFTAAIPALCGFFGGLLGGWVSDRLIRRGFSVTAGRKIPAVIGMTLALLLVTSTLTESTPLIVTIMTCAFFGKGFGGLGWAITTDIAPPQASSFVGSTMNGVGNAAGIVTPIVVGYTVSATGSFDMALWFVGAHGLLALAGLVVMGKIRRIQLSAT